LHVISAAKEGKSIKIDTSVFLDDFDAEAKAHIERIESAFLDPSKLADDPKLIDSAFRAAHSLKGTAGFFAFNKIVSVAHELESLFTQVKNGAVIDNDEMSSIVLQSVDCLKDLVDNLHTDDAVDVSDLISSLKKYTITEVVESILEADGVFIPFDCKEPNTYKALDAASRHGHKIFYINIGVNRSLGIYYKNPKGMLDTIQSVGHIVEAILDGAGEKVIRNPAAAVLAEDILKKLSEKDTTTLELLVTSILDLDLFSIAIGVDKRHILFLSGKDLFVEGAKGNAPTDKPKVVLPETRAESTPAEPAARKGNFSIRLDMSTINGLMDLANEMILTRNRLRSTLSGSEKTIHGLAPVLHDMNRLTSDIQEKVMYTRMQPVGVVFSKFPRIIHDTAKILGKPITVEILRDDVTLDKYLLESLTDPITQLVKNAADHGLETEAERIEAGKPPKGKVTLDAYLKDSSAIIMVSDDGRGINTESIKKKVLEKGLATEEALETMSDNEIFNFMFEPGFSTASTVTNLSGRGVGMDIVKTNIEKLGGFIEVESKLNVGTTIRLSMPLTLSVMQSLLVTIDTIEYAVSELCIERIVRIGKDSANKRIEKVRKSLVLVLDNSIIPLISIDEIAAKVKGLRPLSGSEILKKINKKDTAKCIILKTSGVRFALLIDDALVTEQVLVKPLPIYLRNCPCYSNVTVLGNGKAVTILDIEGIARFMDIEDTLKAAEKKLLPQLSTSDGLDVDADAKKQIVVIKCSGNEYFAVETKDISRIEVINRADIQEMGKWFFVNVAGESIRIVRPEDYTPVKKSSYTQEKLYLLTLKNSAAPLGFLVSRVLDTVDSVFYLDSDQLKNDFILGTSVYSEKILIFLNPTAITAEVEAEKERKKVVRKSS